MYRQLKNLGDEGEPNERNCSEMTMSASPMNYFDSQNHVDEKQ